MKARDLIYPTWLVAVIVFIVFIVFIGVRQCQHQYDCEAIGGAYVPSGFAGLSGGCVQIVKSDGAP